MVDWWERLWQQWLTTGDVDAVDYVDAVRETGIRLGDAATLITDQLTADLVPRRQRVVDDIASAFPECTALGNCTGVGLLQLQSRRLSLGYSSSRVPNQFVWTVRVHDILCGFMYEMVASPTSSTRSPMDGFNTLMSTVVEYAAQQRAAQQCRSEQQEHHQHLTTPLSHPTCLPGITPHRRRSIYSTPSALPYSSS